MTKTPRTDAAAKPGEYGQPFEIVDAEFARELERELTAQPEEVCGWVLAVEVNGQMVAHGPQYHTRQAAEQDAELPKARNQKTEVWTLYRSNAAESEPLGGKK